VARDRSNRLLDGLADNCKLRLSNRSTLRFVVVTGVCGKIGNLAYQQYKTKIEKKEDACSKEQERNASAGMTAHAELDKTRIDTGGPLKVYHQGYSDRANKQDPRGKTSPSK
jgi:hypothetical protein